MNTQPYSATTQPYSATNTSYSTPPSSGGPMGGNGATSIPNYGASSGAQPDTGSYPYGSNHSTNSGVPSNPSIPGPALPQTQPMTGSYNGGWDNIQTNNPARPPEQPAYGANSGVNANSMNAQPYVNPPSPTNIDPRSGNATNDPRYDLPPDPNSPLPNAAPTSPNNSYGPADNSGTSAPPRDTYTPSDTPNNTPNANGYYQPGSVSSYDAANKPAVLTASPNPTTTWR
jgi:hypothetical protein